MNDATPGPWVVSFDEWLVLLALGESLPVITRLQVASLASRAMSCDAALLAELDTGVSDLPPRLRSLTSIPGVDYSWAAFLEAWLSGDDDHRWASEPVRRCRQASFLGETPLRTDKVLVDVLLLRDGPDDASPEHRLTITDPVAARVASAIRQGTLEECADVSPLARYLAWKWCGDLRLLADDEQRARDAYRAAYSVLENECESAGRAHFLPSILLSVLWLEPDGNTWRPWLAAMRRYYAATAIAGTVESVRWRKEFDDLAPSARWLSVNERPVYPVELSRSHEWQHLEFISDHAVSLMDSQQMEQAAAVIACSTRLACAAGCFTRIPELLSLRARHSLANGDYLAALLDHVRAGREDMARDVKRLGIDEAAKLTETAVNHWQSLRAVADAPHAQQVFRASNYARLLRDLVKDLRVSIPLRAMLLPEMLRLLSEGRNAMLLSADVARASAEAVIEFVQSAGPTVLEPYCEQIASTCLERLKATQDWRLNEQILRILFTMSHVGTFARDFLAPTIDAVLAFLDTLVRPGEPWPAVLPAFGILALSSVLERIAKDSELRVRTLVQTRRHFAGAVAIARLHPDLPLAIFRALEPGAPERRSLAEQAILEARIQSSESMRTLRQLVTRGQLDERDLLAKIASEAARIISWRGDEGEMAISVAASPSLIYELAKKDAPAESFRELWDAVRVVLEECRTSPSRVFVSDKAEENRVQLANWTTALLVLADKIGERETADALVASVAEYSKWAAGAVLSGRINTGQGRITVAETIASQEEFYSALPYHLARGAECSGEEIQSLVQAALRYGPNIADVGVLVLAIVSRLTAVSTSNYVEKDALNDYHWRLDSMDTVLRAVLRPLLRQIAP